MGAPCAPGGGNTSSTCHNRSSLDRGGLQGLRAPEYSLTSSVHRVRMRPATAQRSEHRPGQCLSACRRPVALLAMAAPPAAQAAPAGDADPSGRRLRDRDRPALVGR
jgi:hypothetical protein